MNLILKSAVGATLALAAAGANALGVPATDSSDLVLVVQNESNLANVYVLDTGISINSALGTGTLGSNAVLDSTTFSGYNGVVPESSTLATFLAANPASGDGWALEAAQYSGVSSSASPVNASTKNAGKAWGIFSSNAGGGNYSGTQLGSFQGFLGGIQADLTEPADSLGLSPLLTKMEASSGASYSAAAETKYGLAPSMDLASLGTTGVTLYGMTGNGTTAAVQSFILGSATLSATGLLTLTGNTVTPPTVPLPPAVWLLGSGLLGLVGVSRRRKTA
jgi:hypothetical protein